MYARDGTGILTGFTGKHFKNKLEVKLGVACLHLCRCSLLFCSWWNVYFWLFRYIRLLLEHWQCFSVSRPLFGVNGCWLFASGGIAAPLPAASWIISTLPGCEHFLQRAAQKPQSRSWNPAGRGPLRQHSISGRLQVGWIVTPCGGSITCQRQPPSVPSE